jgi:hypothetical protein
VARRTEAVELPAPPLGLAKTIVGMENLLCAEVGTKEKKEVTESYQISESYRRATGSSTDTMW